MNKYTEKQRQEIVDKAVALAQKCYPNDDALPKIIVRRSKEDWEIENLQDFLVSKGLQTSKAALIEYLCD